MKITLDNKFEDINPFYRIRNIAKCYEKEEYKINILTIELYNKYDLYEQENFKSLNNTLDYLKLDIRRNIELDAIKKVSEYMKRR